jgi:hypothetical protein
MTEEEAKTKWCPMWRIGQVSDLRGSTAVNNHSAAKCIGSDCMMWRTKPIVVDGKYAGYEGYCGLAGKPC